ncbi:Spore cortex biosynthesis protein, YabQ-like [Syntrophomonas zehnderi OL-4]|uniref:Spore cortex biosynthesis protein, YabQ-like n=1 Tax=Syntrophomonas zehnderi OL-4 TaxID=690567 RepID=A0A0E4GAE3_9FIRM|nr:spore cortex biosynthesis protein YabQ [Syntrophomonas zehnderi]CFX10561.1 Spore cortex biosynthesis protein, YabQ-like [Syntrophomonas zehnderi OL-4]
MLGLFAQIKTFFLTLLLGLIAGMVFHYYQLTVRALRAGRYSLYLLDISIWGLMILLISIGMLLISQGELRIYFFVFLIAGGFIYFKLLSSKMKKPLQAMATASEKGLRKIVILLQKPIQWARQRIRNWRQKRPPAPPPADIEP